MSSPEELFSKQLTYIIELMRELVETKDKLIEQIQLNTRLLNQISENEKSLSKKDAAHKSSITHKFTDEHFRQLVQDLVGHETLYQEDIEGVDELYVVDCPCKELSGLEYFTNLKNLCIRWSYLLTSLTIPELPNLKQLYVGHNGLLTSLTIPQSRNLGNLQASGNHSLTSLTIPELPKLEQLCVNANESLTSLTVPELPRLKYLEVWSNSSLTSLIIPERLRSIADIGYNHPDIKIEWV